ncbi:hypothetical protein SAY86_014415 [Trapa natans]|uniref:Uncharacterized protein n=1 Tax=Trapa natans TaxID=22666 RepID=A0AAN7QRD1_TRANT|nr:hypothetical protein SAY86_014415 [Trapa natans]
MAIGMVSKDTCWWAFTLPAFVKCDNLHDPYVTVSLLLAILSVGILSWVLSPGGSAWRDGRSRVGRIAIPGLRGLPVLGSLLTLSRGLAHRSLAAAAWSKAGRRQLMAFSLGQTPVVVASDPSTAREVLTSSYFADRPLKQSARSLMFGRAIGFAPSGTYWRLLRRIASSHLFSPKRISAHEPGRQLDCNKMVTDIAAEQASLGHVSLREHLQLASLNNIVGSVFGKRYDPLVDGHEMSELTSMVREGFELLGAFNWCDHLTWLSYLYDPHRITKRCAKLVPRVSSFVRSMIASHRARMGSEKLSDGSDFIDVLLSLDGEEKLDEDDMVAVLWVR